MNKLPDEKRVQILNLLVEGMSMRSTSRVVGVSINTVTKLLVDIGQACATFHDEYVRSVPSKRIQCDEIWSFCYAKARQVHKGRISGNPDYAGDVWTWTALDPDSKLIVSWHVSTDRDTGEAIRFMNDLHERLALRVQISTDGNAPYLQAMQYAFGEDVDFAQLVKTFGTGEDVGKVTGSEKTIRSGRPDYQHISTSIMERHNLTTRMQQRRFTRETNAHSKKLDNHCHSLAIYFVWYNFCRPHSSLGSFVTPAMASGLTDEMYGLDWLLALS